MSLIPLKEAQDRLVAQLSPLPAEEVLLEDALDRILAEDLYARRTQPPFNASAMDGFAVRHADLKSLPVTLKVMEEIPAGSAPRWALGPGQAARLYTGSPLPKGADTVVIQENTTFPNDLSKVTVNEATEKGAHIRPKGTDFCEDDLLLEKGFKLAPRHIMLAAAGNYSELPVTRRPRVGLISSGNELVSPGGITGPGQIIASNGPGLATWLEAKGAAAYDLGIVPDDIDALTRAITQAAELDLILTIGGASVGAHDLVGDAIKAAGGSIDFWRVAMKPGKPVMVGEVSGTPLIGLPGNPVSAFVGAELFVAPTLAAMTGAKTIFPTPIRARLAAPLPATGSRQEFIRARMEPGGDGVGMVHPFDRQDSSLMSVLASADALIIRAIDGAPARAGEMVEVLPLN